MKPVPAIWVPLAILVATISAAALGAEPPQPQQVERVTIGAIRWDAWFDDKVNPYEKNLADKKWHNRLPFFARVLSDQDIQIHGDSQEAVDREIAYAKAGGIDYWAFLYYPATTRKDGFNHDHMNRARRLYLSSKHKADVNFCLIIYPGWHADKNNPNKEIDEWVRMAQEPTYQKVAGGRPLFYVMVWGSDVTVEKLFGSNEKGRKYMDDLRERIVKSGQKNPYFVVLSKTPGDALAAMKALNLDAMSAYTSFGGSAYQGLCAANRAHWAGMKATGKQVVPNLNAGWGGPRDGAGDTKQPTPAELGEHMRSGIKWLNANRAAAEARTMLIYAWNEVDEGGWLVPDKGRGTARLDAIRSVVDEMRAGR